MAHPKPCWVLTQNVGCRSDKWFGMKTSAMTHDAKYTLALLANRYPPPL